MLTASILCMSIKSNRYAMTMRSAYDDPEDNKQIRICNMTEAEMIALWEEHTRAEFATRDVEATLATMVEDAHVNHVPVMTGGYGKSALREFYGREFISSMPEDTSLTLISRTVGGDQIVDEMIFQFTHDQEMPWML